MKKLSAVKFLFIFIVGFGLCRFASAADEICTFSTTASHYANLSSPPEPFAFKWRKSTGQVLNTYWLHGGVKWFSYVNDRGSALPDKFPGDYHVRVNLGITTAGFESTRYQLLGFVQPNVSLPNATFSAIYEGSGSAWFVAYGKITCAAVP